MSEEPLRIRLPKDFTVAETGYEKPALTIEEYDKQILQPTMERFAACKIGEELLKSNMLSDALFYGLKPPTRWQRFKRHLYDYQQRAKDIWTILRGKDIHEDCGY